MVRWLKLCDLSEDKAQRYMKLARHRAELDPARVRNLSLSAALKLIARKKPVDGPNRRKRRRPLTSTRSRGGQAPLQKLDPASLTVWGSNRCLRRSRQAGGWKRSRRSVQFLLAPQHAASGAVSDYGPRGVHRPRRREAGPRRQVPSTTSRSASRTKITDPVARLEFAVIWKRT